MKPHQPTIIDLAKQLGISKSTVSRALTGHPHTNPDTRRRVLELAQELDYQRNTLALSLAKHQSFSLGMVVPEIQTSFFSFAITGAQEVASKAGYTLFICQSGEAYATEVANVRALAERQIDGILTSLAKDTTDVAHLRNLQRKGVPLVMFNRVSPELDVSKVVVSDREGAFQAVEHLILAGCKRIAHLAGPSNLLISQNRLNGYLDALRLYQLPVEPELIAGYDLSRGQARVALMRLLDLPQPPDAIFCINDPTAIEVMQILKVRGLKVPDDIALVGFSDDPASSLVEPALTTVAQPVLEMGQVAAQLLLEQIATDPDKFTPQVRVLKTKLVVRRSSVRNGG
jgi:LacI family transcriptional regulator/LacI family repressor for deo operon, udp, cdd, tsx, nupC, and nupG